MARILDDGAAAGGQEQEPISAGPQRGSSRAQLMAPVDEAMESERAASHLQSTVDRLDDIANRLEAMLGGLEWRDQLRASPRVLPDSIDGRRRALKPPRVRMLFVTAPVFPGDTTNFYLANSHLFRCVRGAFVRALGSSVPQGEEFLWFFRDQGCWMLHAVPEPSRGPGRPRRVWVRTVVRSLVEAFHETDPDRIVSVKLRLRPRVEDAARMVGLERRVVALPTPRALWDAEFIDLLRGDLGLTQADTAREEAGDPVLSLLAAVRSTLLDHSNKRQRARDLAQLVDSAGRFSGPPPLRKAQVSAVVRAHPDLFDVNSAGIRLRDGGDARRRHAASPALALGRS